MDKKKFIREYGFITAGIFIIAAAVYFFMIPSNVIVGSLSGLVIVLANFIPLPISVMTFILNGVLLIIGFIFIGKEFGAKTVYTSALLPVFLFVFEKVVPDTKSLTGDILIDTICYVLVVSVGLAMLFNANASSGGLDIAAKILNKYMHVEIGKAMTITGMCVAVSSVLVYDTKSVIMSILATYVNGIVIDNFISGFNRRKRVCILSDHYGQVQKFIVEELKRGVTLYKATGGYNKEERTEIETILTQNEYGKLLEYLHTVDMKAFVTVSTVNEVIGEWNIAKKEIAKAISFHCCRKGKKMKLLYQFGIILGITFIGEILHAIIPLPIPASIYGLVLMLICLCTKVVKLNQVKNAADFLIEIMPPMFIPAAVGIMVVWADLQAILVPVVVITFVSTVVVMVCTGRACPGCYPRKRKGGI